MPCVRTLCVCEVALDSGTTVHHPLAHKAWAGLGGFEGDGQGAKGEGLQISFGLFYFRAWLDEKLQRAACWPGD